MSWPLPDEPDRRSPPGSSIHWREYLKLLHECVRPTRSEYGTISGNQVKSTERTLKTRRILLSSALQPAILSWSFLAWASLETGLRPLRFLTFLSISATVLRSVSRRRAIQCVYHWSNPRRKPVYRFTHGRTEVIQPPPVHSPIECLTDIGAVETETDVIPFIDHGILDKGVNRRSIATE